MSVTREIALASIEKSQVYQITLKQLLILIFLGAVLSFIDFTLAKSVVSGGMVAIVPHLYFTFYAFRYPGGSAAANMVRSFYRGEAGKFVLALVGFASVFLWIPTLNAGALFGGYIVMLIVQLWLTARVMKEI